MERITPVREAVVAGLAVMLLHTVVRLDVAPGVFQDDAMYLGLGKALATGEGWRSIYAVGQPVHLKYPPGLSTIYAAVWGIGGTLERTLALIHGLHLVVAGLLGGLLWWTARVTLRLSLALATVALLPLLLVSVVDFLQLPVSEGPFLAAWAGAVALALQPLTRRRAVVLGLLLALVVLLRSQGWAVLIGVLAGVAFTSRDRRVTWIASATALVPVLAWTLVHRLLVAAGPLSSQPDEVGYLRWWLETMAAGLPGTLVQSLWANGSGYASILPLELGPAGFGHALLLGVLAFALWGAVCGGRRFLPLSLSVGFSILLLLVWPITQGRFMIALLPIAALLTAAGLGATGAGQRRGMLWTAVLLMVAVLGLRQVSLRVAAHAENPVEMVGFEPIGHTLVGNTVWMRSVAPWVRTHTPPDAHLLTEGAAGLWLVTGRTGVAALPAAPNTGIGFPPGLDPERYLPGRLIADSITWVLASSPPVLHAVARVEQACPGTFRQGVPIDGLSVAFAVRDTTRACVATLGP